MNRRYDEGKGARVAFLCGKWETKVHKERNISF